MENETPNISHVTERELVSAFIICMNEEDQIKDCLDSLKFCDEVIVIDSFSTDRTVEIAREWGAQIYQRKWSGYKDQKAFGLSLTKHEWTINLDADERISPELRESILSVLHKEKNKQLNTNPVSHEDEIVGYNISRVIFYLNRWWRKGGWYPEYRLRFFKKSKVVWGGVDPHEKPIPKGRTARIEGEIYHYTYDNMDEQFGRLLSYASIAAEEDYKRGAKPGLLKLVINPILRSVKFYITKKGYREGMAGFIVAVAEGFYAFVKYARLWECEVMKSQRDSNE